MTSLPEVRPFDARRDLGPVADLVELCFADTMDSDGRRYLEQMRSAARNPSLLNWAGLVSDFASIPMNGYVYEDHNRLVGNLSLLSYSFQGERIYLIANVAVHPDYRRQGIGRELTLKGIEHARQHASPAVWLQVREENIGAVNLYKKLGFTEKACRTTWCSTQQVPDDAGSLDGIEIRPTLGKDWNLQCAWLSQTYPEDLRWHLPLDLNAMQPGLKGKLRRFMSNKEYRQVAAVHGEDVLGVVSLQTTTHNSNIVWLAIPAEEEATATRSLLMHLRKSMSSNHCLTLDFPAHQAEESIRSSGFYSHQTLIWMAIHFR